MSSTRFPIRVKPGSSRPTVGGTWGDEPQRLVVAVAARAVDGMANRAVIDSLAQVLGVRRGDLRIVKGDTSRSKVIEVDGPSDIVARIEELMNQ